MSSRRRHQRHSHMTPGKILIRFQCVCRHWRDLFKTPSFIADHLHYSNHRNPYLLFQRGHLDYPSDLYSLDSEMQLRKFQNPPFLDHFKRGKILASSNGLLCVETNEPLESPHSLLVWNPAIKEVRLVPKTNLYGDCYHYSVGFGFCPSINDYKIVITYYVINFNANDYVVDMFKVYSLRSRSWKDLKYRFNACCISYSGTFNGVMFWVGLKKVGEDDGVYRREDYESLCFSFDLAMEVWTVIPVPEERPCSLCERFTVYEEKLAFLSCPIDCQPSVLHLWVMEEGVGASGKTWNWIKKYTSNPYPGLLRFTAMWRNEIFCRILGLESTAVLFNPTTKKIKKLNISKCNDEYRIFNYVESLVSIGGTKSFTKFPKHRGSSSGVRTMT
ncbi:hypothetical protein QN277_019873 [Acacia crassicarpa]|uniref:F-box associated beta-propeller type 1 domain-containing protein n=1 Tax=Acacia crassicarpa TaxID=499986 RepID=A0AAE1MS64_9FABA|nr:hypothetical protein QN277_019873 [Acacia crassicarpa]